MKTQADIYLEAIDLARKLVDIKDDHEIQGQVWDAAEALPPADRASFKTAFEEVRNKLNTARSRPAPSAAPVAAAPVAKK